jgi:riboflavin kinase/FMN adenylyltransferase
MQKIGMKTLVIGYDHHFGRNREGSYKDLEEMAPVYGFRLEEINEQVINHVAVSSTKVRKALLEGDITSANQLLGHRFSLRGKVMMGDKIGRTIGFPTANLDVPEGYKLIPAVGIYAVQVRIGQVIKNGMLYIGYRPVLDGTTLRIEVNIFDFDEEIYGQELQITFVSWIRGDMNFEDLQKLKEKLNEDKAVATKMLS